jgi:excisionase family DNA binding protein
MNNPFTASQEARLVYLYDQKPSVMPELFSGYPDLLTVNHISEITGLSEQTVRKELEAGTIPACHIGRRWYVAKTAFITFIEGDER